MDNGTQLDAGEFVFEIFHTNRVHAHGNLFYPHGKPLMSDDWISTAKAACPRSQWPRRQLEVGDRLAVYVHRASKAGDFYFVTCARELSPGLAAT